MKKVALIQSQPIFTEKLKKKYLGNIPLLTSTNVVDIYKFINTNAKKNCIFKFVLHVNSGVLDKFIDYIYNKKKVSMNARKLLSKCIFIATYSNANSVREKNIQKNTNIYFSLTPISECLKMFKNVPPEKYMLIVSDVDNPYYNQIYETNVSPKYRISDSKLTLEVINNFNKTGGLITMALDNDNEYQKLINLILNSDWKKAVCIIELNTVSVLQLVNNVAQIHCSSSGVSMSGDINYYKDLNNILLYENCAALLINEYERWEHFIKNKIVSMNPSNHNVGWAFFN